MSRRVILATLTAGVVMALAVGPSAQAPKAIAGTWKLNLAKSKFNPGPAPKSMTVTYSPAGDTVKIEVHAVPATGAAEHWVMSGGYDGKDNPVTGNSMADTVAFKRIDDTTGESVFKKAGKVTSTNTRVLSADGKVLTITSKGTTADGKPRTDVQVFEK